MHLALVVLLGTAVTGGSAFHTGGSLAQHATGLQRASRLAHTTCGRADVRMQAASKGKLLVLGGTGFVGSTVTKLAISRGYDVVSMSRRGTPPADSPLASEARITWKQGDATKAEDVQRVAAEGGFTGVVHAIGMLFEGELNKFASGSGSIPSEGVTYDDITRRTAFNAMDAAVANGIDKFGFVSAAEARWDFDDKFVGSPVEWLHRYLVAKRSVEARLDSLSPGLRSVIVRPSLIWTWEKPGALLPVAAFTAGNALGIPFVDKPVSVDLLAKAMLNGMESESEAGIFDYTGMERLADMRR